MTRAQELKTLVAAYTVQLAEDTVSQFINGGGEPKMTRAEELRTLVAIYTRQLDYLATMAETGELKKTPLQLAEDAVSQFINGGGCTTTTHEAASRLAKLVMLKMLRMEMPHTSMEMTSLEHEIKLEAKRCP